MCWVYRFNTDFLGFCGQVNPVVVKAMIHNIVWVFKKENILCDLLMFVVVLDLM